VRAVVLAYNEIGYVCLEEVIGSSIEVAALFTHKDDPAEEIWFRTPRALALKHAIPVFDPESMRDPAWIDRLRSFSPDYLFSFYYRHMLPQEVLDIPRVAAMNLHGSLLPAFRGRCPVNWVLIKGEKQTGVTLHIMEAKPDAGDIVAQRAVEIAFEDTALTLAQKLASAARTLMRETMPRLESATFERTPQTGVSSYYGGRRPEDGLIDWKADAGEIYNLTRAVTHPYPGAYTLLDGKRLFIWKALPKDGTVEGRPGAIVSTRPLVIKAGRGLVAVESLQIEGEVEIDAATFIATHELDKKLLGGTL
jgi:methionyl-tRNA formyltransferase